MLKCNVNEYWCVNYIWAIVHEQTLRYRCVYIKYLLYKKSSYVYGKGFHLIVNHVSQWYTTQLSSLNILPIIMTKMHFVLPTTTHLQCKWPERHVYFVPFTTFWYSFVTNNKCFNYVMSDIENTLSHRILHFLKVSVLKRTRTMIYVCIMERLDVLTAFLFLL